MPDRSLEDWLCYLEARHPVEIDLGLERITAVAGCMALSSIAEKTIIVAGTNGKGSCVRTLESYYLHKGLRVGAYTSPHILRYNERIRICGKAVEDKDICGAFEHIEAARGNTPLTYFEVGTLAALDIMASRRLDVALLEVGMGGRFDAVNLVDGDLAIITSIDLDHCQWLGDNREAIGYEKVGIARPGRALVCADSHPPKTVLKHLQELGCPTYLLGRDFGWREESAHLKLWLESETESIVLHHRPQLPLPSIAAAHQALAVLEGDLDKELLARTCVEVSLPGRYQRAQFKGRQLIFDVAHNPAAARYLATQLTAENKRIRCVIGIMADKDVAEFIEPLLPLVSQWHLGDLLGVRRALPAAELGQLLYTRGCALECHDSLESAFFEAIRACEEVELVLVCGSFYSVSRILKQIEDQEDGD